MKLQWHEATLFYITNLITKITIAGSFTTEKTKGYYETDVPALKSNLFSFKNILLRFTQYQDMYFFFVCFVV